MFSQWLSGRGGKREALAGPEQGADRVPKTETDLADLDDETLASRLAEGDHEALTILFARHSGLVYRIARKMLRNDGEAEETVQQIFLDAYRAISQFDRQKASFKTWLMQYAYHRTMNRRQHLQSRGFYTWKEIDNELPLMEKYDFQLQMSRIEIAHLVSEALTKIKPQQRRVIELTFYEGLTAEEISQRIGETASSVRHNLYRGMARLRAVLEQRYEAKAAGESNEARGIFFGYEGSREF